MFRWDPVEDKFIYTGKSYILEGIRAKCDMSKEGITSEIRRRTEVLEWMKANDVRSFKEVSKAISRYTENPEEFMNRIKEQGKDKTKHRRVEKQEKTKEKEVTPKKSSKGKKEKTKEETFEADDNESDAFKDFKSIDENIANLLYENGFTSIESLEEIKVKDLAKIAGIKKKMAKTIKKEIEGKIKEERDK